MSPAIYLTDELSNVLQQMEIYGDCFQVEVHCYLHILDAIKLLCERMADPSEQAQASIRLKDLLARHDAALLRLKGIAAGLSGCVNLMDTCGTHIKAETAIKGQARIES